MIRLIFKIIGIVLGILAIIALIVIIRYFYLKGDLEKVLTPETPFSPKTETSSPTTTSPTTTTTTSPTTTTLPPPILKHIPSAPLPPPPPLPSAPPPSPPEPLEPETRRTYPPATEIRRPFTPSWIWNGCGYIFPKERESVIPLENALAVFDPCQENRELGKVDLLIFPGSTSNLISVKQRCKATGRTKVEIGLHLGMINRGFVLTKEWLGNLNHFWPALEHAQNLLVTRRERCMPGRNRNEQTKVFSSTCSYPQSDLDWDSFELVEATNQ